MSGYVISRLNQSVTIEDNTAQGLPTLLKNTLPCFDLHSADIGELTALLEVHSTGSNWLIRDTSTAAETIAVNAGDLAYFLSDRIIYHLIKNNNVGHCLHAACVARGDKAIIMPGVSGAGKSSLTCWFLANGFDYVSDELVILLEADYLKAIPRPLQIKHSGIDVIKSLKDSVSTVADVVEGGVANSYAPNFFGSQMSQSSKLELTLILFPHYLSTANYSFELISKASAAKSMMGSHVNARSLSGHGFHAISTIAKTTPAYQLVYGGYEYLESKLLDEIGIFF